MVKRPTMCLVVASYDHTVPSSLNHLGKKCFSFSSMDKSNIPDIVAKI